MCKICSKLPKEIRDAAEHEDEILGYLKQSHISDKNISRLGELVESPNSKIAEWATLVFEIGKVKPHKKSRLKLLRRERPDLLAKLEETGLIMAHHW